MAAGDDYTAKIFFQLKSLLFLSLQQERSEVLVDMENHDLYMDNDRIRLMTNCCLYFLFFNGRGGGGGAGAFRSVQSKAGKAD